MSLYSYEINHNQWSTSKQQIFRWSPENSSALIDGNSEGSSVVISWVSPGGMIIMTITNNNQEKLALSRSIIIYKVDHINLYYSTKLRSLYYIVFKHLSHFKFIVVF